MKLLSITASQTERGWDVSCSLMGTDEVFPTTSYKNATLAAARVLQLMEISLPVTPQNYPEAVCIGNFD